MGRFFSSLLHSLEQNDLKPSAGPSVSALSSLEMSARRSPAPPLCEQPQSMFQHPSSQERRLVAEWWDAGAFWNLSRTYVFELEARRRRVNLSTENLSEIYLYFFRLCKISEWSEDYISLKSQLWPIAVDVCNMMLVMTIDSVQKGCNLGRHIYALG